MRFHDELSDIFIEIELITLLEKYHYCFVDHCNFEPVMYDVDDEDDHIIEVYCYELINNISISDMFCHINDDKICFDYADGDYGICWKIINIAVTDDIIKDYSPTDLLRKIVNKYFTDKIKKMDTLNKKITTHLFNLM